MTETDGDHSGPSPARGLTDEALWKAIFDQAAVGIALIVSHTGQFVRINKRYCDIVGYTPEEMQRLSFQEITHPDDLQADLENMERLLRGEIREFSMDKRNIRKDGSVVWVNLSVSPMWAPGEEPTHHIAVVESITERKHAENKLRLLGHALRSIGEGVCMTDEHDVMRFVNEAFCRIYGYTKDELLGQPVAMLRSPAVPEDIDGEIRQWTVDGGWRGEILNRRKDGTELPVALSTSAVRDEAGEHLALIGVVRDISDRREAAERLREAKEHYEMLLEISPDAIVQTGLDGTIVYCNARAAQIFGFGSAAELRGRDSLEFMAPEDQHIAKENAEILLREGRFSSREYRMRRRDGSLVPVEVSATLISDRRGEPASFVGIIRDITERQRMEGHLHRVQRLESLGVLAGGLAHDFNNLLAGILGSVSVARALVGNDARVSERLEQAERATFRARELTQQLLTFSRGGEPQKVTTSIGRIVREAARFALRGSNVTCEFEIPPDLWPVDVDAGQLGQVVQNLVINADQAMPEGGSIRIAASNTAATDIRDLPLPERNHISVVVADEGAGIPGDHLHKVFDPYYTTKETGRGLGLATTYSIIRSHDGHITVDSAPGHGTTFTFYLPASAHPVAAVEQNLDEITAGAGRVLLVDDDEGVRDAVGEMLHLIGYEVETAADGTEAIAAYRSALGTARPFDVVIMDLTIPGGMGGREAIQQLLEVDPQVRAVVSSGYSSDAVMARHEEFGFRAALAKPYRTADLSRVLAEVLSDRPGSG